MGAEHAMSATIVDGWPAVAAKTAVLGLIADHVMPGTGYICLWADDDPGQLAGQTWEGLRGRLEQWAEGAKTAFGPEGGALDAWAMFDGLSPRRAEIDLPGLVGTNPRNGDVLGERDGRSGTPPQRQGTGAAGGH